MARYNHLPIFKETYELALVIYSITHQFPREYKYTLGQQLKEMVSVLMNSIVAANAQSQKQKILEKASIQLEQMRIHVRLAHDLKIMNMKKYEVCSRAIEEIAKQLSGWITWSSKVKN